VAAANVVIEATIHTGQVERAVELYKKLHDICKGGPNTETFNALLQGTSRHDRKDLSMFLAGEMQALGIKPDYLTYDRLILACLKQDDYEDAFRYLEEMVDVGADQPDGGWYMRPGTAKLMIERCVGNGDQRTWKILDEMDRRQMKTFSLRDWADQKWKGPPRDTELKAKVAMWATV
jgi:pentatricopeptide repeat protein